MITVASRLALLGAEQLEDLLRRDRIEPRGRLVVEDDRRARHGRPRHADPLLLAAREPGRHALLETRQIYACQPFGDAHAHLVLGECVEAAEREGDIVADVEVVEERIVLEEHADLLAELLQSRARGAT